MMTDSASTAIMGNRLALFIFTPAVIAFNAAKPGALSLSRCSALSDELQFMRYWCAKSDGSDANDEMSIDAEVNKQAREKGF